MIGPERNAVTGTLASNMSPVFSFDAPGWTGRLYRPRAGTDTFNVAAKADKEVCPYEIRNQLRRLH